ncbi:MAG: hypothetical protein E6J26_06100 [Chloroflexi bacterium]|nr:MAG: hypothetical protein E6J26_06100 [Chloroflexota bacterium]
MRKFALPLGLFLLALLGTGLLIVVRAVPPRTVNSSAQLTPDLPTAEVEKVMPTQVAALPVSAAQVVPFSDAVLARDLLLDASKAGPWSEPSNPVDIRDYPAWRQRFPNLGLSGYAVAADARHVSVYRNVFDPKQAPSESNPRVIAFAVADLAGRCAAGVLMGYPTYTTFGAVDIGSAKCKAQSVLDRLQR